MDVRTALELLLHGLSQLFQRYPGHPDSLLPGVPLIGMSDALILDGSLGNEEALRQFAAIIVDDPHLSSLLSAIVQRKKSAFGGRVPWGAKEIKAAVSALVRHLQVCRQAGACVMTFSHRYYPSPLRFIPDPPYALSIKGMAGAAVSPCLHGPGIAVVGSRKASRAGLAMSRCIGSHLAESGYCVVSGGAYGIDISAHLGVIDRMEDGLAPQGSACIVFAGGLLNAYPAGNRWVFTKILEQGGACISERLGDAPARPRDFPVRNRLISGLCSHVVIVEANLRSGTLATARAALDQGREVLVWKGGAKACNEGGRALIEDGAGTFESATELLGIIERDKIFHVGSVPPDRAIANEAAHWVV